MSHNDIIRIHLRQRARRTAQSPAELACWMEGPQRKSNVSGWAVGFVLFLGAVVAILAGALT